MGRALRMTGRGLPAHHGILGNSLPPAVGVRGGGLARAGGGKALTWSHIDRPALRAVVIRRHLRVVELAAAQRHVAVGLEICSGRSRSGLWQKSLCRSRCNAHSGMLCQSAPLAVPGPVSRK